MADRARRRRARRARWKMAWAAPATGRPRHRAGAAAVVAARQAEVAAALPRRDWVTGVPAARRLGRCAAERTADWVARPAVGPDAQLASRPGGAANSSEHRPAAG